MSPPTLPFETLTAIFKILPTNGAIEHHLFHSDLLNCSLVSRDWRAAALPLLWEKLNIHCEKDFSAAKKIRFVLNKRLWQKLADTLVYECASTNDKINRASHIRDFTLKAWDDQADYVTHASTPIISILKLFQPSQLRNIKFTFGHHYADTCPPYYGVLQTIFPALSQQLEHLSIGDHNRPCLVTESYDGDLPFFYCNFVLQHIPKSLRSLRCGWNGFDSCTSLKNIFILPKLHSLAVINLNMTADVLDQGLRTWHPNFHQLCIVDSPKLFESSVVCALADFYPNLTSLTLYGSSDISQTSFSSIGDESLCYLIDSCHHLGHLRLRYVTNLSNRFLIHCARHAHSLQLLDIKQDGVHLTGEGVVDMSGWKQCLKTIEIQRKILGLVEEVTKMDEKFISAVVKNCKNLRCWYFGKIIGER